MVSRGGAERRSKLRPKRRRAPGRESIDVRTSDGWSLRAEVREPDDECVGTAVLAHAMMARRSEFDRPPGGGLSRLLGERGWRVVAFDFRAHGDSGPAVHDGGRYAYDDLVARDLPAIHAFARDRSRGREPVVLVGHSLGGHTGLAAQGAGLVAFDALVTIAANVWLRELEPSPPRWLLKRASLRAAVALCRRVGRFPARVLRLGSDDESLACFEDFDRFARSGAWTSADGRLDYLSGLDRIRAPVMQIVSDGDRFECAPECGARFVSRCGGRPEVWRVGAGHDGSRPLSHMGLVTSHDARPCWTRAEAWLRGVLRVPA